VPVRSESLLLLSIEDSLQLLSAGNVNSQQLYVFAMNNKASPPSINASNKCSYLFPYYPSLEGGLAGEQTVQKATRVPFLKKPHI
jgi:hypothetical protein